MTDVSVLHKYWNTVDLPANNRRNAGGNPCTVPKYTSLHPKIIAFEETYQHMKKIQTDDIWSSMSIDLPFQVQENDVEYNRIGDRNSGAYILYVDCKAYGDNIYNQAHAAPTIMID